jgi:hypothetical protein
LTPNIRNWTVNSSQGSWSCPGQARYIWQHMAYIYLSKCFVENPQNGSRHNGPKDPPWWKVPPCPCILTPNITNWTVNSSQGSWSCPGQARYIWQHMAYIYLSKCFVENPQNGSRHNGPKNPSWWKAPPCAWFLTPNITNWTVNSSQGSWSCPGQARYIYGWHLSVENPQNGSRNF